MVRVSGFPKPLTLNRVRLQGLGYPTVVQDTFGHLGFDFLDPKPEDGPRGSEGLGFRV